MITSLNFTNAFMNLNPSRTYVSSIVWFGKPRKYPYAQKIATADKHSNNNSNKK